MRSPKRFTRRPVFLVIEEDLGEDAVALTIAGGFDAETAPALRRRLEAIHDRGVRRIVLDLAEVSFIDAMSVACIAGARELLGDEGRLALVARHPHVLLILEIGGLDEIVDIFRSRDAAVAHVASDVPVMAEPAKAEIHWAEGFGLYVTGR